ncbi:MAG: hypothetical protein HOM58_02345 [Rhodospirillaceae bacterium]|mgnify:CR=1 FL=1|jgi:hypothetical protein|nr:hypothetical protein [Rhodospirillaceae bacterium]MBT5458743.1 hypothetical protein [Rhodospirillaceae bacterium]
MGTKQNVFVKFAIAGLTAAATAIPGQAGASVLPGPKPPVVIASASKINKLPGRTVPAITTARTTPEIYWATKGPLDSGIGKINAGSSQANWGYVPKPSRSVAGSNVSAFALSFYNDNTVSFNRDTAVVVMDRKNNWWTSNSNFGGQFKAQVTEWSTFSTDWTASSDTQGESEWRPNYKSPSQYKTVSEFCPLDISKEFNTAKGCGRYSNSLLSVLRVMDNFLNWVKSLWGGGSQAS